MKRLFAAGIIILCALATIACSYGYDNDNSKAVPPDVSHSDPISDYDEISVILPEESTTNSSDITDEYFQEGSSADDSKDNSSIQSDELSQTESDTEGIVVKHKKYDYKGSNIVVLSVENKTKKDYTITIIGAYYYTDGTLIKQESKSFQGFASGFQNYFIFNPNVKFERFEFTLTTEEFNGTALSKYLKTMDPVRISTGKTYLNGSGGFFDQAHIAISASFQVANTYNKELFYSAEFVVFNNKGEIYVIDSDLKEGSAVPIESGKNPTEYRIGRYIAYTDVLWKDKDGFVLPDELQGDIVGIVCIESISD